MEINKGTIVIEGVFKEGYTIYFEEYSQKIKSFLKKNNGVIIRRQLIIETLYGQSTPNLIMIIDFPKYEIAKSIFFEAEYMSIIPLRDKIFKNFNMHIATYDEI